MINLKDMFLDKNIENNALKIVEGAIKAGYYMWYNSDISGPVFCGFNHSTDLFSCQQFPKSPSDNNEHPKKFESDNARIVALQYFLACDSAKDVIKSVAKVVYRDNK